MAVARRLAEFTAGLQFADLPPEVVASAVLRTLDIVGIALAASGEESAPSIFGALDGWGAGDGCVGKLREGVVVAAAVAGGTGSPGLEGVAAAPAGAVEVVAALVAAVPLVGEGVAGTVDTGAAVADFAAVGLVAGAGGLSDGADASVTAAFLGERSTIGAGTSVDAHAASKMHADIVLHSLVTTILPQAMVRTSPAPA